MAEEAPKAPLSEEEKAARIAAAKVKAAAMVAAKAAAAGGDPPTAGTPTTPAPAATAAAPAAAAPTAATPTTPAGKVVIPPKPGAHWPYPPKHKPAKVTVDTDQVKAKFPTAVEHVGDMSGKPVVYVKPDRALEVLTFAKETLAFQHLAFVSAADYVKEGILELHWQLYHYPDSPDAKGRDLVVKAHVPRDNAVAPSVVHLWKGADWHEREGWDLLGIKFEGHPDLRRIFMPEGWRGHPLRKDYDRKEQYIGMNDVGDDIVYDTPGPYRW